MQLNFSNNISQMRNSQDINLVHICTYIRMYISMNVCTSVQQIFQLITLGGKHGNTSLSINIHVSTYVPMQVPAYKGPICTYCNKYKYVCAYMG